MYVLLGGSTALKTCYLFCGYVWGESYHELSICLLGRASLVTRCQFYGRPVFLLEFRPCLLHS